MKKPKPQLMLSDYFSGCLYFTAGHLFRDLERMAFEIFRSLELAPTHAFLIMALHQSGDKGATPSELSETLNLDRSTITRLIATLQKKNIVKTSQNGKFKILHLTAKGAALMPEIRSSWSSLHTRYCSEWSEKRAKAVNESILKNILRSRGSSQRSN